MPITQDRMLALIRSAEECYTAFTSFQRYVQFALDMNATGTESDAQTIQRIIDVLHRQYITPDALFTIGREKERFNYARQHDNRRRAERMRQRRGDLHAGIFPRQTCRTADDIQITITDDPNAMHPDVFDGVADRLGDLDALDTPAVPQREVIDAADLDTMRDGPADLDGLFNEPGPDVDE